MSIYDYRIETGALTFHGTGTITVSLAGTAVTGSGTAFTTQLTVGAWLERSAQIIGSAKTITDNTHLHR